MTTALKTFLKSLLPPLIIAALRRMRARLQSNEQIFSSIYRTNRWGGTAGEYYSGRGSDEPHASHYANLVRKLIADNNVKTVVDIGCGDFRIGGLITTDTIQYIGIDVVPQLIQHNNKIFGDEHVSFQCLDAAKDPLPDGDLCLIRQVLQHLSNDNVATILKKTKQFRLVVITEHHPVVHPAVPNEDMVSGPGNRTNVGSGVYPHLAPFSIGEVEILSETPLPSGHRQDKLTMMLFRN